MGSFWTATTTAHVGAVFGSGAHCAFADDRDTLFYGLALLNGKINAAYLHIISPTLNTNVDDIRATPYKEDRKDEVVSIVKDSIETSRKDWDSFETSWDFQQHPLLPPIVKKEENA